jgi:hypothetical protein
MERQEGVEHIEEYFIDVSGIFRIFFVRKRTFIRGT